MLTAALPAGATSDIAPSIMRFAPNSRLAEGNWVKIGVDESGVYEISHATLRAMGFSNPERVGLYGKGGKQMEMNFVDQAGRPLYTDDLSPVPVLHHEGKLYFYAQGTTTFSINTAAEQTTDGFFSNSGRNIYSDLGYYFLSDSERVVTMEHVKAPDPNAGYASEVTYGYGRVSHEVDLYHNNTSSGQIFYGEDMLAQPDGLLTWPAHLNDAIVGMPAMMECTMYLDYNSKATWSYGVLESDEIEDTKVDTVQTTSMRTISPKFTNFTLPAEDVNIFVKLVSNKEVPPANLDQWVLTYPRAIPSLRGAEGKRINQDMIAFPNLHRGDRAVIRIPEGATYLGIDISLPLLPRFMEVAADGADGMAAIDYTYNLPEPPSAIIFDPLLPQKQIKGFQTGYSCIRNQNLHAQAAEGAELIIICIPQLKEVAERLAEIHLAHDGIRTLIATTDECYNEFSAGVPDPMAYRALVKATMTSPVKAKNVLLLGPLYADFRGIISERQQSEGIIAYQAPTISQERGAHNANDIIGMMDDYISLSNVHTNRMQVGVGILPVRYPAEAQTLIEKIEKYLEAEDIEYYLNAFTNIGGVGDSHTHAEQAILLSQHIDKVANYGAINTDLPIDAYGYLEAQRKLFNDLDEGRLMVAYYGHGSCFKLNQEGDFFNASDVYRLRNRKLPFMGFAGCSLTNSDRGARGLGESLVVSTPYGAIGSLLATRETWSGENAMLFDYFYTSLFREGFDENSPRHKSNITAGEALAQAKTKSSNNNELGYQLLGDPAIVLPVPTREVKFSQSTASAIQIGQRNTVSGYVANAEGNGEVDPEFNGRVVLRIMRPSETVISENLCSGDAKQLRLTVNDSQVAMGVGEVVNGQFTVSFFLPASIENAVGKVGRIHAAVYDPKQRTAGGGLASPVYHKDAEATELEADMMPPVVEHFEFDQDEMELQIRVSDNLALCYDHNPLNPSFRMLLDGREDATATNVSPILDEACVAYERRIPLSDLSEGMHTASVTVSDAAGNRTTAETTFYYNPYEGAYAIRLLNGVVADGGTFAAVADFPSEADIVILNAAGLQVRREKFEGGAFEWDACDQDGSRVEPGLYKAYIIQTGGTGRKSHSAPIDVPVV